MKSDNYPVIKVDHNFYQFYSSGVRGRIKLAIIFMPINDVVYNLGFGVWDPLSGSIDDAVETRNGDTDKILGTVAQTALDFLNRNPATSLFARGSCGVRTRKYQMGINKFLPDLEAKYIVQGFIDKPISSGITGTFGLWQGEWEDFQPGVNYNAFLLSLK